MATFSPTREDVERYLRLRAVRDKLGEEMVRHVPRQAHAAIGEALGLLHDGVLVLESKDVSAIMADCCLHDWYDENAKNVVQRYAETHPAQQGTDEDYVLDAFLHAKYRVLEAQSFVPGAGAHCGDFLNNKEELFLMDVGLSRNPEAGFVLATRTMPLGEYWITCGTALPITSPEIMESARLQFRKRAGPDSLLYPEDFSLSIVRACLDAGVVQQVNYQFGTPPRREPRHITRRNRRQRH